MGAQMMTPWTHTGFVRSCISFLLSGKYVRDNFLYMLMSSAFCRLFGCRQFKQSEGICTFVACIAQTTDTLQIGAIGSRHTLYLTLVMGSRLADDLDMLYYHYVKIE